jgi:broad specificity phosphatase PhoE
MIRVILARHGVTAWNQAGRYQGQQDIPLGDEGRRQAEELGRRIAAEHITRAYASDLQRAAETAQIALAGQKVPLSLASQLRETNFGDWEGLQAREIAERYPTDWESWIRDALAARPSGGETVNDLYQRVVGFYQSVVQVDPDFHSPRDWFTYRAAGPTAGDTRDETVLFVTHGGPVRALLTHLLDVPLARYWRFTVRPASVCVFDIYPEGAIAEVIGDTSHIGHSDASAWVPPSSLLPH